MYLVGAKKALPIVLGYIPIGFAYGVLAREVGLNLIETVMMSVLVYAGSAQFIGVELFGRGADPFSIITTTFLVNLRHLLMSASLSVNFKKFPGKILPIAAFGITDETYAVNSVEFKNYDRDEKFVLGLQFTSHGAWILGSAAGAYFHQLVPDTEALGFDFVLYAMFIFLLTIQLNNFRLIQIALISAFFALVFNVFFPDNNWYIMASTIIAATIGLIMENNHKNQTDGQNSKTNKDN
ncbi:AzlC family ABC transporter permease [Natranaerofaba carboxydovora]|uniref:AzlC family ABC transporter permease n=1 Tax=Natranaerofaba carboxydovora TaxID=2742683 RepID=UPI001F131584|nr:AzlC family ABC transporter permease [Natranaerofaba carboxydovora]UMZ74529.1 Inner membrane protein YgaZ [Natranaerofaba carboxydovora]